MADMKDLMTVKEAAEALGVTKARVDQFISDGSLSVAAKAGAVRLLSRKAVAAFAAVPRKPGPKPKEG
ncbi:MAG TPA: helix-turn-helix domain-containing protein [Urbifossiella sp.]|jgi:excisionase family DNA binding protein|nr:helix-turn-helix domain-containing protein [Urbifossiella sp.]